MSEWERKLASQAERKRRPTNGWNERESGRAKLFGPETAKTRCDAMLSRWAHERSQATLSGPGREGSSKQPCVHWYCTVAVTSVHHARHGLVDNVRQQVLPTQSNFRPLAIQIPFPIQFSFSCVILPAPVSWSYPQWNAASSSLATTVAAVRCTSDADRRWQGPPSLGGRYTVQVSGRRSHEVARDACSAAGFAPPNPPLLHTK